MTGNDTQQRLTAFIGRETEYWDFWGTIRIVKNGNILWVCLSRVWREEHHVHPFYNRIGHKADYCLRGDAFI